MYRGRARAELGRANGDEHMDWNDSADQADFRRDVKTFLEEASRRLRTNLS